MSSGPASGDLVLRNSATLRFEVVDGQGHLIDGPFQTLARAVLRARSIAYERKVAIWQQPTDERGRPLSPPGILLRRPLAKTGT